MEDRYWRMDMIIAEMRIVIVLDGWTVRKCAALRTAVFWRMGKLMKLILLGFFGIDHGSSKNT